MAPNPFAVAYAMAAGFRYGSPYANQYCAECEVYTRETECWRCGGELVEKLCYVAESVPTLEFLPHT